MLLPKPEDWGGACDVRRLNAPDEIAMHRFFDTSPISPTGKYVAYTAFPFEDRLPEPGDTATVIVRELATGACVYRSETAAWDTQLGAQVQWGASDEMLLFNRMDQDSWRAYGVVVDPVTSQERSLQGQIYMAAPDGTLNAACRLELLGHVQAGYGVHVPPEHAPRNKGASETDGVFLTDLRTGDETLVLSYAQITARLPEVMKGIDPEAGAFYGFHVKFSPDSQRIMLLLRWLPHASKKTKNFLLSFKHDGSDLKMSVHARDWGNGHHPNWCPDSQSIIMNVSVKNEKLMFPFLDRALSKILRKLGIRYYTRAYDLRIGMFGLSGENMQIISPTSFGSGHPSLHVSETFALTDAYPSERVARGDGTAPLRSFDVQTGSQTELMHVPVTPAFYGPAQEWRVDPHPAWDRTGRYLVINAAPNGQRGLYVVDFGDTVQG